MNLSPFAHKLLAWTCLLVLLAAMGAPAWLGVQSLADGLAAGARSRGEVERLETALNRLYAERNAQLEARGWSERDFSARLNRVAAEAQHAGALEQLRTGFPDGSVRQLVVGPTTARPAGSGTGWLETRVEIIAPADLALSVLADASLRDADVSELDILVLSDGALRIHLTLSTAFLAEADDAV